MPPQEKLINISTRKPLRKNEEPSEESKVDKILPKKVVAPFMDLTSEQGRLTGKNQAKVNEPYISKDRQKKSGNKASTGMVASKDGAS